MNAERWSRIRSLYEDALELLADERSRFLDEHCDDPEIRREVDDLLALAGVASEHFSRLSLRVGSSVLEADDGGDAEPDSAAMCGQRVGPYRLLEVLGRGGMGVVYLAERADGAFEHRVAVKVLPVGLLGPRGHRRFLAERQILARLQHPSIARLIDGGVMRDGTPYIVMEYVDGMSIDRWCDAAVMGVDDRIKLFLEVCETIEYAHRSLVVHRDLKPSNVLVTGEAETKLLGQVKLLDFGIAKLLGEDSPGLTRDELGRIPLTPAWASPEQLAGEPVTTATDVYTLAALLFRLLVGVPPHDVHGCSTDQIRKRVLNGRPLPPSQRIEHLSRARAERLAAYRDSRPEALRRKLRGDLDAILLKGLARKPEDRYGSPGALAADLRRHLDGRPVEARRSTLGYRATRFLGRHRAAVAAAAVIVALVGTVIWTTMRYAAGVAAERDKAQEVTQLLVELFSQPGPDRAAGRQVTARELLDRGVDRLRGRLLDRPLVRATLMHTLGHAYRQLGHARRAGDLLAEALELRTRAGAEALERAATLHELGLARVAVGRPGDAVPKLRRAVALRRQALGDLDPGVAEALTTLAEALTARDDPEGAINALREAVEIYEHQPQTLSEEYARSLADLAAIHGMLQQPAQAAPLFERAEELARAGGAPSP